MMKTKCHYSQASVNFMKLRGVSIKEIGFSDGRQHRCLIIPIDIANLAEVKSKKGDGTTNVYLNMLVYKNKYKTFSTHCIKQKMLKGFYENSSQEEIGALPIIGMLNVNGYTKDERVQTNTPTIDDDLAF